MKVIEDLNTTNNSSVINQVHYGQIPEEFSGMVLYFTLGRIYINGYVYQNGRVVKQVTLNNGNNTTGTYQTQTIKTNGTSCEVVSIYKNYCEWGGTADNPYQSFHGCTQTFVGVAVTCITTTSDDGQVTGDEGNTTGGPGSNDSDNGCPINNGNSNDLQGPSAVIYDDSNDCKVVITQYVIVDKSISDNSKLSCIYNAIRNNSVYTALISAFTGAGYNLKIIAAGTLTNITGKTSTTSGYNDPNVTITISNDIQNHSLASYVQTFIHEAYHAHIVQVLIQQNRMGSQAFNTTYADTFDQYLAYQMDSTRSAYQARGQMFSLQDEQLEQHNIISKDTEFIALGIKEAMEAINPGIKSSTDVSWNTYLNYAWEGLEDSQAFKDKWGDDNVNPNLTLHGSINLLNQFTGCP